MNPDPAVARSLLLLLSYGVVTPNEVIHWAEEQVGVIEVPSFDLIELAYATPANIGEIITRLNVLSAGGDSLAAFRLALGRLHDYVLQRPSEARRVFSQIFQTFLRFHEDERKEFSFLYLIDHHFELVSQGIWKSSEKVSKELLVELIKYR
jgi:hypothetical protein